MLPGLLRTILNLLMGVFEAIGEPSTCCYYNEEANKITCRFVLYGANMTGSPGS